MPSGQALALSELIETVGGSKELECRKHIGLIARLLVPNSLDRFLQILDEEPSRAGRSDLGILYESMESGWQRKGVAFWEVKSPQAALFKADDSKVRFRPSEELIKAETQLLYYFSELSESGEFRSRYGITDRMDFRLGGIIIGHSRRMLGGDSNQVEAGATDFALNLRRQYFYSRCNMRVLPWDYLRDTVLHWEEAGALYPGILRA
jgi:hypothetical protein